jgi:hypothetical protein
MQESGVHRLELVSSALLLKSSFFSAGQIALFREMARANSTLIRILTRVSLDSENK